MATSTNTAGNATSAMGGGWWTSLLSIGDTPAGSEVQQTVDVNALLNNSIALKNKVSPVYIILGVLAFVAVGVTIFIIIKKAKK